jgi:hypothetical protein
MNHMTAVVITAIALCCLLMEQSDTENRVSTGLKVTNGVFAFAMIHSGIHAGNGITAREDTTKEKWKREKEEALKEKIKNKPKTPTEESNQAAETEGSSWVVGVFGCLGDIFSSACFEALFGDDEEEETGEVEGDLTTSPELDLSPPPEGLDEQAAAEAESPYPYVAIVIPTAMDEVEVTVWDNPGGAEAGASIGATLPQSTEVNVLERIILGETTWLRIETMEKPKVSGWILEEETESFEQP